MRCFGLIRVWNDPACTFSFQFGCGIMLDLEPHHKFLSSHMTVTLGPEENIKTKRRCRDITASCGSHHAPLETQRRVRPPPAPPVKPHPEGSQEAAEWRSWATELGDMFLRNDTKEQASVPVDTMDDAAQAETLERDAEKQRLWDIAVALAVEEMRWPERRDWFRCEREQEERQRMQEECDHTHLPNLLTQTRYETPYAANDSSALQRKWNARVAHPVVLPLETDVLWPLSAAAAPKAKSASTNPVCCRARRSFVLLHPKQNRPRLLRQSPRCLRGAKLRAATHKAKPAPSEIDSRSMEGVRVFHREPDWSEASDDDEYDPASRLPHFPRWNISSRRIDAMFTTPTRKLQHGRERTRRGRPDVPLMIAQLTSELICAVLKIVTITTWAFVGPGSLRSLAI
ncbi:hypothetical protein K438DRAFT_1785450 [Mycena galopus ATCC 62051]|nr:hypothetical protein K438DRAFT_1785450 [Mycena galopus ATCC 62051]